MASGLPFLHISPLQILDFDEGNSFTDHGEVQMVVVVVVVVVVMVGRTRGPETKSKSPLAKKRYQGLDIGEFRRRAPPQKSIFLPL
ncbi:hypothetical protein E2C01_039735 [Portunus trituberculatus]|uniref:Uncharacterized protein n=1 Tax=Portunus trituberculatus TaxID=210409 RepID=A0A5B7FKQ8_PORTR|nr:hypothetical protein [Portunus trituberculatus]